MNPSSPRMREQDLHRPRSGAPTEVIDLSSSSSKQGPAMSAFWKGGEDQVVSAADRDRGRGPHGPPSVGPHERMAPPPYGVVTGYPPSPRHGPSTAPGSRAQSRRNSFSAIEEGGARPSSSHSLGPMSSNHQQLTATSPVSHHRPPPGVLGGRMQTSPILQHSSSMVSPRSNSSRLPPLSPSSASPMVGSMRSPVRINQTLPPPPNIPTSHSQSTSKPTSPVETRRRSPPPLQTRSPLIRDPQPLSGHQRTSSPMVTLPHPSLPLPPNHPSSRLPPVSLSEKHSPNLPKMKAQAVPIDGS